MVLVDTSVWIAMLRDKSGIEGQRLRDWMDNRDAALTRFTQLELLQGCRDETEWRILSDYLEDQIYLETQATTWTGAARMFFELRRQGLTVRSPIDCCIAQIAIERDVLLLHNDRDFEAIASVRPLQHCFWVRAS
jgi:predicted nucleic acid-binding protein